MMGIEEKWNMIILLAHLFTKIAENLNPKPPIEVLESCKRLKYRHHIE